MKKIFLYTLAFLTTTLLLTGCLPDTEVKDGNLDDDVDTQESKNFILEDYPEDVVPLYEMTEITSMSFFVNDDPQNYAGFFDEEQNYYNVVFKTSVEKQKLFNYYESLMSETESRIGTRLQGLISKYKVSVSAYEDENVYIQLHLPEQEYFKENKYFGDYPNLVEKDSNWIEHESTYTLANQLKGEVIYRMYFTLNSSLMDDSYAKYKTKYSAKDEFFADDEQNILSWIDGDYSVRIIFHKAHSRIYLTLKRDM